MSIRQALLNQFLSETFTVVTAGGSPITGLVQADFSITLARNAVLVGTPVPSIVESPPASGTYTVSFTPGLVGVWDLQVVYAAVPQTFSWTYDVRSGIYDFVGTSPATSLTRLAVDYRYRSSAQGKNWDFVVRIDQSGVVSLREVIPPYGSFPYNSAPVPEPVALDVQRAMAQIRDLQAMTSSVNGTLVFSNASTVAYTFATPLASALYRVLLEVPDFVSLRVVSKTSSGFTVEASAPFTGTVFFDVVI